MIAAPRLTIANRQQAVLFTLPAIVVSLLLMGFPMAYTAWLSFHRWFGSRTTPMDWLGLRNYTDVLFRDDNFQRSFTITLFFTAVTVTASIVVGVALALLVNRGSGANQVVLSLLMIPVVSTPVAVSMTWKYIVQYEGLLNALTNRVGLGAFSWLGQQLVIPVLAVIDVTRWTPLVVLIILAGLSSLPTEPIEAARIDGASPLQLLRFITLPLLRPFIGVAALIRVIDALKTFDEVLVISGGGPAGASETLYMYAYKVAFSYLSFGYVAAVLVLLFLAVLAASLVVVRLRRAAW